MPLKADASSWIWTVGGIMIAMVILVLAVTLANSIAASEEENRMLVQLRVLGDRINSLCVSADMAKDKFEFRFTDLTKAVYPASEENELPPENVQMFVSDGRSVEGRYVCLQLKDRKTARCRKLSCNAILPYLGPEPKKSGVLDILSGITGESKAYRHFLELEKADNIVIVRTEPGGGVKQKCNIQSVPGIKIAGFCSSSDNRSEALIFAKEEKVAIITDALPWIEGNKDFMLLLENIAKHFGGGKILVVWDNGRVSRDKGSTDPADITAAKDLLQRLGADSERHQAIAKDKLDKYGQLWLIRPGFCSDFRKGSQAAGCDGTAEWDTTEIAIIADFVKKGKRLLIITDAGPKLEVYEYMPPRVINSILSALKIPFLQLEEPGCYSGRDKFIPKTHETVNGVGPFGMKYTARFDCRA
ncbi:MAG: hypothetical protein HYX24_00700 [Candidatus Aenigmarchaeota archaeon]|nr:hypothetical protein [Candidatus Aenigmarchaeota archaeon]